MSFKACGDLEEGNKTRAVDIGRKRKRKVQYFYDISSWVNWMWSLVPNLADDQAVQLATPPPTPLLMLGFYVSQVTVTIKLTGRVTEGNFFGGQRFEFKPVLSFEFSGGAAEIVMKGDEFFDAQAGVSSVMGWNIGDCVCGSLDVSPTKEGIETDERVNKMFALTFVQHPDTDYSEHTNNQKKMKIFI